MTSDDKLSLNRIVVSILAPLLFLVGIAGFLIPSGYAIISNAAPYNLFHILFGALGLVIISLKKDFLAVTFNASLGVIDLYQVIASFFGLTPQQYFLWTPLDDFLHLLLGVLLVGVAWQAVKKLRG